MILERYSAKVYVKGKEALWERKGRGKGVWGEMNKL